MSMPPSAPPPPPTLPLHTSKHQVKVLRPGPLLPNEEVRKLTGLMRNRLNLNSDAVVLSYHRPVPVCLQDGPMCGLVALAIAGESWISEGSSKIVPDVHRILVQAKLKGFTKQGEMFSAKNMATLANDLFHCHATVVNGDQESLNDVLLDTLRDGNMALIPYDADGNHEPCMKKGHKAHWALITGYVTVVTQDDLDHIQLDCNADGEIPWLYHCKHIPTSVQACQVHVYARHGKSQHTALWDLTALQKSNANLQEPDPKIAVEPEQWILPREGIDGGLCSKVVILNAS